MDKITFVVTEITEADTKLVVAKITFVATEIAFSVSGTNLFEAK